MRDSACPNLSWEEAAFVPVLRCTRLHEHFPHSIISRSKTDGHGQEGADYVAVGAHVAAACRATVPTAVAETQGQQQLIAQMLARAGEQRQECLGKKLKGRRLGWVSQPLSCAR